MARHSIRSPWVRESLQFLDAVERAGRWLRAVRRGVSVSYGLTVPQWRVLKAAGRCSVAPSVAELARRMRMTRQSAHETLLGLRRSGFVSLARRGTDRRTVVVCLTESGERLLETLESTMRSLLLELTYDLSPRALEISSEALTDFSRRLRSCRSILEAPTRVQRNWRKG